jgi:hypothetical protein
LFLSGGGTKGALLYSFPGLNLYSFPGAKETGLLLAKL